MQVELRHQPSFSVARIHLRPASRSGRVRCHGDALVRGHRRRADAGWTERRLQTRRLGGESLFVTTFTGHQQVATWVDVAANLPGDIWVADVDSRTRSRRHAGIVAGQCRWVSHLDTKWGGAKMFGGGEGAFVLHATGRGSDRAGCVWCDGRPRPGRRTGFHRRLRAPRCLRRHDLGADAQGIERHHVDA